MGLFDVLSQLEEAFFARSLVATQQTVDDVSYAVHSVCSLAVASCSLSGPLSGFPSVPSQIASQDYSVTFVEDVSCAPSSSFSFVPSLAAIQDDSVSFVEEGSSEGEVRLQDLKRAQDCSDAQTAAPVTLDDELTSLRQDLKKELPVLFCDQILCGALSEQTLLPEASENPKKEEEGDRTSQDFCDAAFLFQSSGRAGRLQDLDSHCLSHVMSFLNSRSLQACSLVCRQWLEASNFARSDLKMCTVQSMPILLKRFGRLRRLRFSHSPLELEGVHSVPASAAFNDKHMRLIAKHCPLLQKLDLLGCWAFTDEGLAAILMGCSDLRALELAWCDGFTGDAFTHYFSQRFERIRFTYCAGLTNSGVVATAKSCPGLRELSLVSYRGPSLEGGIRKAAMLCSNLEKVIIHGCGVTDDTLLMFAFSCKKIHTFCIGGELNFSGYGIDLLRSYLPFLRSLGLRSNPYVEVLSGNRFNAPLKRLNLTRYIGADKDLEQLLGEGTIEELVFEGCWNLSDVTVERIFTRCRHLTFGDL